jgi:imidazole glycerol-phosphate synthase subunit HisH
MICIVDYGMGNLGSIQNIVRKVGGHALITNNETTLMSAKAIILPGVGSFDNGITKLRESGLVESMTKRVVEDGVPFLGVCLGMHLIFDRSEEGELRGLGWLPGNVQKFNFNDCKDKTLKIPHMGWNQVRSCEKAQLFSGLESIARFYFVHSYHVVCDEGFVAATADYGYRFVCSVEKENIFATQFHPEKSHKYGMKMFRNFVRLVC